MLDTNFKFKISHEDIDLNLSTEFFGLFNKKDEDKVILSISVLAIIYTMMDKQNCNMWLKYCKELNNTILNLEKYFIKNKYYYGNEKEYLDIHKKLLDLAKEINNNNINKLTKIGISKDMFKYDHDAYLVFCNIFSREYAIFGGISILKKKPSIHSGQIGLSSVHLDNYFKNVLSIIDKKKILLNLKHDINKVDFTTTIADSSVATVLTKTLHRIEYDKDYEENGMLELLKPIAFNGRDYAFIPMSLKDFKLPKQLKITKELVLSSIDAHLERLS